MDKSLNLRDPTVLMKATPDKIKRYLIRRGWTCTGIQLGQQSNWHIRSPHPCCIAVCESTSFHDYPYRVAEILDALTMIYHDKHAVYREIVEGMTAPCSWCGETEVPVELLEAARRTADGKRFRILAVGPEFDLVGRYENRLIMVCESKVYLCNRTAGGDLFWVECGLVVHNELDEE